MVNTYLRMFDESDSMPCACMPTFLAPSSACKESIVTIILPSSRSKNLPGRHALPLICNPYTMARRGPACPSSKARQTPQCSEHLAPGLYPLPNVTTKATEKPKIATTRDHRSEPKPGAQRPPSALSNAAGPAPRSPASTTAPRRTRGVYATAPFARPLLPVVPPHKAEVSATTPHNSSSARTRKGPKTAHEAQETRIAGTWMVAVRTAVLVLSRAHEGPRSAPGSLRA